MKYLPIAEFLCSASVEEGVGLRTRYNLHRTDHMKKGKQRTADSQLTA